MKRLSANFFLRDAVKVAQELIGYRLIFKDCGGVIIETEAYREKGDEACHLFSRPSARQFTQDHSAGAAYVYLNYGIHWLVNVLTYDSTTKQYGFVLFRALAPDQGSEEMKSRRNTSLERNLCSGPGKLTQALRLDGAMHGADFLTDSRLLIQETGDQITTVSDRRIGISRAKDHPWRFLAKNHPGVSVPLGKA